MIIELLYFTVIHTCEHVGCKPYRRNDPKVKLMQMYTISDERTIYSPQPCKICSELYERSKERRVELAAQDAERRAAYHLEQRQLQTKRYLVDGHAMSITQDKLGVWRGKCQIAKGKQIQKYFGRKDPREGLVEVI